MKSLPGILALTLIAGTSLPAVSQTIGTFNSVSPGTQSQTLVLPATHTFQRLIKSGDALSLGGTLGDNLDFTGYVPISGSSTNGRLSISTESTPAQVAILDISFNTSTKVWNVGTSGKVLFDPNVIGTVARFCSGTVTPNGTIMVSEEDVTSGDVNSDGYTDRGWIIEIDPATRTVINQDGVGGADKLWAIGRTNRENAAIKSDNSILYTGADDPSLGYLYKFVPSVAGNWTAGNLYALQTTSSLGNAKWVQVANSTTAERNGLRAASTSAGAYNFNGIEDVEIGPDGKIYFSAKGEGKIYRFTDNGTYGSSTDVSGLEVFVGNSSGSVSYDVDGAGPLGSESWSTGNDNMAFDGEGNLWVLQDGGRNHIWVVAPSHTQASPQVRLFAKTPAGSEPTGISFSPDYRYMFVSFQHPSNNTTSQTDAAGTSVLWNTHTTVVIARTNALGSLAVLPVNFTGFTATASGSRALINWSVNNANNHDYFAVERSVDGTHFETISRNNESLNSAAHQSFSFTDERFPGMLAYYRIRQCDLDGKCSYTDIKTVRIAAKAFTAQAVSTEGGRLSLEIKSDHAEEIVIRIYDTGGRELYSQTKRMTAGTDSEGIHLGSGMYVWEVRRANGEKISQQIIVK